MKHFFCVVFVFVSFTCYLQAEEVPRFIELVGHEILDDSVLHYVQSIAFSPDSKQVVTVGADYTIRIWDADSGKELRRWDLTRHDGFHPFSTLFSSDGKKIVALDGITKEKITARIWDVESGKELPKLEREAFFDTFPVPREAVGVMLTGDGGFAGFQIQIGDDYAGKGLKKFDGGDNFAFVTFSPDGKKIVAREQQSLFLRIWDIESRMELQKIGGDEHVSFLAFSSDGKKIALTEKLGTFVRTWDVDSGKELKKFPLDEPFGEKPFFLSCDGKKIVGKMRNRIRILDTESREMQSLETPKRKVPYHLSHHRILSVVFSPDEKKIGIACEYGFAGIWVLE